jgi:hypothetical protein
LRMGCNCHRELCNGKSCPFHKGVRLQRLRKGCLQFPCCDTGMEQPVFDRFSALGSQYAFRIRRFLLRAPVGCPCLTRCLRWP